MISLNNNGLLDLFIFWSTLWPTYLSDSSLSVFVYCFQIEFYISIYLVSWRENRFTFLCSLVHKFASFTFIIKYHKKLLQIFNFLIFCSTKRVSTIRIISNTFYCIVFQIFYLELLLEIIDIARFSFLILFISYYKLLFLLVVNLCDTHKTIDFCYF